MLCKFYMLTSILVLIVSVYPARAEPTVSIKQFTTQQLLNPNWIEKRLAKVGIKKLIADYKDHKESNVVTVRDALVLSQTIIEKHPEALRHQLQGRLVTYKNIALKPFQILPTGKGGQLYLQSATLTQAGDPRMQLLPELTNNSGSILAYAISPDGKLIVIATPEKLEIWNRFSRKVLKTLVTNPPSLLCKRIPRLKFTPDGKKIISNYEVNTQKIRTFQHHIWDSSTGKLEQTLQTEKMSIYGFAITFDSKFIIAAADRTKLGIWEIATGKFVREIADYKTGNIDYWAISYDNKTAATYHNRIIKIWDIQTGKLLHEKSLQNDKDFPGKFSAMGFSPDSKSLLFSNSKTFSSSNPSLLKRWEFESTKELISYRGHLAKIRAFVFPAGGKQMITADEKGTIKLWDYQSGTLIRTLFNYHQYIMDIKLTDSCEHVMFRSSAGLFAGDLKKFYDQSVKTKSDHAGMVEHLMFTPDGKKSISYGHDMTLLVKNLSTQNILWKNSAPNGVHVINDILITPDGKRCLTCSYRSIREWDIETGKLLRKFPVANNCRLYSMAWGNGGKQLWASGSELELFIWDYKNKKLLETIKITRIVKKMIPPQGLMKSYIGVGVQQVNLIDKKTKLISHQFGKHAKRIRNFSLLPNGKEAFLSIVTSPTISRMGLKSGEGISITQPFAEHTKPVTGFEISPDGQYLVSVAEDKILKLWNIKTGQMIATYYFDFYAMKCCFSPDGNFILVGDRNGHLHYLKILNVPQ